MKVTGIETFAGQVDLYKNGGGAPIATATSPPEDFGDGEHIFTGLPAHAVGDYYTATQTTGGVASGQSGRRCVQPLEMNFTDDFEACCSL